MANDLNVKIGAIITEFEKTLDKAKKDLTDFGSKAGDSAKQTDKITSSSKKATPSIRQLSSAIKGNASISDVATDAAESLIGGIENVSKGSKDAAGGLKLSGTAITALSVAAVAGAVALLKYAFRLTDAAKATDALSKATAGYIGKVGAELSTQQSLLRVIQDRSKSDTERQRALDKLNELTKGYTASLTLENTGYAKSQTVIDKLTKSMIRNATIKGLQSRISKIVEAQYDNENKSLESQLTFMQKVGNSALSLLKNNTATGLGADLASAAFDNQAATASKLKTELDKLIGGLDDLIGIDVAEEGIFSGLKGNPKAQADAIVRPFAEALFKSVDTTLKPAIEILQDGISLVPPAEILTEEELRFLEHQARLMASAVEFNDGVRDILEFGVEQGIGNIAGAIGGALVEGDNVLKSVGAAFLGTLGGILVDLGKMAIGIGVGIKGIKIALKTLNPVAAIAAGAALIAIGTVFKGTASKLGDSIGSGSVSGGGGRGNGSSFTGSTSRGNTSGGGFGGGTVVFEISGTSLIGVLSNTTSRNTALGGQNLITG